MKSRLKLNNVPIWNLLDLQKAFSPLDIYRQLPEYIRFAKVHSCFLVNFLEDPEGNRYEAEHLTKDFWLDILTYSQWPEAANPQECLQFFLNERYAFLAEGISDKEDLQEIHLAGKQEAADAQIQAKLTHICTDGNLEKDSRQAVSLLAICQLAELDARNYSFAPQVTSAQEICHDAPPRLVPEKAQVDLIADGTVYRFFYHDEDQLQPNTQIRTVLFNAISGNNRYERVVIELYSSRQDRCLQTITLQGGQSRRCNVAAGKIIRFLPDIRIENGCSLYRAQLSSQTLTHKTETGTEEIPLTNLTDFLPVDAESGYLLVRDGRLNMGKCKALSDRKTELMLTATRAALDALNVVEIGWVGQTVKILTDDGNVYSVLCKEYGVCRWMSVAMRRPERENCISLKDAVRVPEISTDYKEALQVALSEDRTEAAILMKDGRCELRQANGFSFLPEQNKVIVGGSV